MQSNRCYNFPLPFLKNLFELSWEPCGPRFVIILIRFYFLSKILPSFERRRNSHKYPGSCCYVCVCANDMVICTFSVLRVIIVHMLKRFITLITRVDFR